MMPQHIKYRSTEVSKVAIIGAGLIGASWAAYFLKKGLDVHVYDPAPGSEKYLHQLVSNALADLSQLNTSSTCQPGKLAFFSQLHDAIEGCDYIQENGPEKLDLKQSILSEIDALAAPDIVIGSSTSSFICSALQIKCQHPDRILVAHPFNPPHLIPLVELGSGKDTSASALEAAYQFFTHIGKVPVKIQKEAVGHIANRLTAALWREAVHIVAEDIATVADVDKAICYGPGLRWAVDGPHMLYHLGGGAGGIASYLQHLGPTQETRWKTLGNPTLDKVTCEKIISGIEQESEGRSLDELSKRRDTKLIALLNALSAGKGYSNA